VVPIGEDADVASVVAEAVGITAPGGPEVLRVVQREVRDPGPGEVRIAVGAAAVNPTDIGLRTAGVEGVDPPWTPGMDAAGLVESVGSGVRRLAVGERVMAAVSPRRPEGGAQAELIVVPAASVVPVPAGASIAEAATLPMNGLTALLGLELLNLTAGATLAVTGGAGLLASYVIPLAKQRGVHVLADANESDAGLVRSFGADAVLPRGEGFADALRDRLPLGADGVFDTAVLGRSVLRGIRTDGAIAVVRSWDGGAAERGIRVEQVWVRTVLERTDWLDELRAQAGHGRLQLRVAAELPADRAAEAHRLTGAGGLRGRALIVF